MTVYGGFWIRFVAYIIDAILLAIVGGIVGAVLGVGLVAATGFSGTNDPSPTFNTIAGLQLASMGINLVMGWLYYALMESSASQGTLGKMALGLVVSDESGNRIGFGRATGRYFGKFVSSIILCIGFIMVGLTDRKQGLHDMMAGTLVTKKGTFSGTDEAAVFS